MEKTVCLCLMSLFDSLPNDGWRVRLTYDCWLEKSVQDETEYYDIWADGSGLVGCDGEIYEVLEETPDYVKLLSHDADESFRLSRKEFECAINKVVA